MGFQFIHAADLHIDSPMLGLERYESAPLEQLRGATRRAFENLVQLAIDEKVALVVLAGDLFDESWRDYNTGIFFCRELARLERAGIRVVLIHGNHDAAGDMARTLRWPSNTRVLSAQAPETVLFGDLGVAVHGQSFKKRDVRENLAARYPVALPGVFNLGLLHTALEGAEGHAPYAPCSVSDLVSRGYGYWALGHVHKRIEVAQAPHWVVFPGNIQGRSVRETGSKGCSVVTVEGGRVVEVRHEPLDVVRWALVEVDVSGEETAEDVVERLAEAIGDAADEAEGRLLAVRAKAIGATQACTMRAEPERWRSELIARLMSVAPERAWLEKLVLELSPPREGMDSGAESLAVLERLLEEVSLTASERPAFVSELEKKVGAELARDGGEPLFDEAGLASLRADAGELLREALRGKGGRA